MQNKHTVALKQDAATEQWLNSYFDSISLEPRPDENSIPAPTYTLYAYKSLNDTVLSVVVDVDDHIACSKKHLWVFKNGKLYDTEIELSSDCDIEQSQTQYNTIGFTTSDTVSFVVTGYYYSASKKNVTKSGEFRKQYNFDSAIWNVDSTWQNVAVYPNGNVMLTLSGH